MPDVTENSGHACEIMHDPLAVLNELIRQRILILDGAMGTMIQALHLDEAAYRGNAFADHPSPTSEGPARRVRSTPIDDPSPFAGHDKRAPPNHVFR